MNCQTLSFIRLHKQASFYHWNKTATPLTRLCLQSLMTTNMTGGLREFIFAKGSSNISVSILLLLLVVLLIVLQFY